MNAHYKKGQFIKAHHHINTTYLFMASENQELQVKADENSAVKWIEVANIDQAVTEEEMRPCYHKLMEKALLLRKQE